MDDVNDVNNGAGAGTHSSQRDFYQLGVCVTALPLPSSFLLTTPNLRQRRGGLRGTHGRATSLILVRYFPPSEEARTGER